MSSARGRLTSVRRQIEAVDERLVDLLAERAALVAHAWAEKARLRVPRHDPEREAALIAHLLERAAERGLDPERVRPVLERIIGRDLRGDVDPVES